MQIQLNLGLRLVYSILVMIYDGFNDKFKEFLESVKVTKDNFYTIMPIQNMKTRPNAVYNFN